MEKFSVTLLLCISCATVCVKAQQSGTLPSVESKSSSDSSKFTPIITNTNSSPKFSIGLGVLSPSYTQRFGDDGKAKLDFNQDSGGYSYSLTSLAHPMAKNTDRSGSDDKKYSSETMKAADASSLTPGSQYSPNSYSLSSGSGSRSDFSSIGIGYPQNQIADYRPASQPGPPNLPQSYGPNYPTYSPNYSPMPSYGPPAYGPPMPYQGYPNSGSPYSQSGAYNPSPITPVTSNMQSSPAQVSYNPMPVASAPAPQPYPAQPQAMPPYSPYMAQMPSPYGGYGQASYNPYNMYSQPPQASPYGGYGGQYASAGGQYVGGGGQYGGAGGFGMYGSPSQASASTYPYGGGSSDPLANLSPGDISTLRQLYGASSTLSPSVMSPYGGMGGGMSSYGGGSGMGGYGGYGGGSGYGSGSSLSGLGGMGGGLSSLISLFG